MKASRAVKVRTSDFTPPTGYPYTGAASHRGGPMRAENERTIEQIKQSLKLLRRHL
jgi:hypothetical protein